MKNLKSLRIYLVLVMVLGLSVATTSCGDDASSPEIVSAKDVEGNYTGKMLTVVPTERHEASVGVDVSAVVDATDVVFAKFPVSDLIETIVGKELAPGIIEAVGDVTYKLPYTAALNKDYTSINLTLKPEPLVLKIALPSATTLAEGEAEAPKTTVTVTISAAETGVFTYEGKKLKFGMSIDKVMLGETEFPMPVKLKLSFDLAR